MAKNENIQSNKLFESMCAARAHLPYFTSECNWSYNRNIQRGQESNHARAYVPYFSLERNVHSRIGVKSLAAGWNGQIGSVCLHKKVSIRAYAVTRKLKIYKWCSFRVRGMVEKALVHRLDLSANKKDTRYRKKAGGETGKKGEVK